MKTTKYYIASASEYLDLEGITLQIKDWQEAGTLDPNTKVYEITSKTKVYKPALELEEVK